MSPARVRLLRRVVITATSQGLDQERLRWATDDVRPGDDVILCVRGSLSFEPAAAAFLGRALMDARTVTVEAGGPGARQFAADLAAAALAEVPVA